jgi:hypothetical protein
MRESKRTTGIIPKPETGNVLVKLHAYPPGAVIILPGSTSHFHWAKSGDHVTQVTAIGLIGLEYIDAKDDPLRYARDKNVRGSAAGVGTRSLDRRYNTDSRQLRAQGTDGQSPGSKLPEATVPSAFRLPPRTAELLRKYPRNSGLPNGAIVPGALRAFLRNLLEAKLSQAHDILVPCRERPVGAGVTYSRLVVVNEAALDAASVLET